MKTVSCNSNVITSTLAAILILWGGLGQSSKAQAQWPTAPQPQHQMGVGQPRPSATSAYPAPQTPAGYMPYAPAGQYSAAQNVPHRQGTDGFSTHHIRALEHQLASLQTHLKEATNDYQKIENDMKGSIDRLEKINRLEQSATLDDPVSAHAGLALSNHLNGNMKSEMHRMLEQVDGAKAQTVAHYTHKINQTKAQLEALGVTK